MKQSVLSESWNNDSDIIKIEAGLMKKSLLSGSWINEKNAVQVEARLMTV